MNVYEIVTNRMLEEMKKGIIPWKQPWVGGEPKNLVSKKSYRGINVFLLPRTYSSAWWISYKQAQSLGGQVKKGEKGYPVVFWKTNKVEEEDEETGKTKTKTFPILRYYTVFNIGQCEGIENPDIRHYNDFEKIRTCEMIVGNMPVPPPILFQEQRAYYNSNSDTVNMPKPESFTSKEHYYSTLFHELTHSTGHKSRLDRFTQEHDNQIFGSSSYSKEELTAELGAAMLAAVAQIDNSALTENSTAYLQNWMKKFGEDQRLLVQAAAKAQKSCDFILGVEHINKEE